jgi:ferrous iron transport protein B
MNVAFAGNPNVGKTALINAIAGSKLKVGNWPGVTVEKKEAEFDYKGEKIQLVDLPGIYSLSPYTIEERITRDFILNENPDCIVDVVDSTNLERNLYLTLLLMEMEKPIVVALNIFDEFEKSGYKIDLDKFKQYLGIDIITTVATKNKGLDELTYRVVEIAKSKKQYKKMEYGLMFDKFIENEIDKLVEKLKKEDIPEKFPLRWLAIKLIEKDEYVIQVLKKEAKKDISPLAKEHIIAIEERFNDDTETILTEARYGIINGILKDTLKEPKDYNVPFTEKMDKIVTNKYFGLPIFFALMYVVFKLTFDGSGPFIDWTDGFINGYIGKYTGMALAGTPDWLNLLVVDGIIGGVGLVLTFVPLMLFIYFFLSLLEESGYMSRAAFVLDKIMHSIGLNGKSFIPMILGFGCNVPAIYATRALENERDRKLTAVLVPFMSCGARLPIYALFTGVFFIKHQASVVLLMYILGIAVAIGVGLLLKNTKSFETTKSPLLLELPPYRMPTAKMVFSSMWMRTRAFLKKAGSVILVAMIVLWAAINLPSGSTPDNSYLGRTAKVLAPIFAPTGFDNWQAVASILPGIIAKESVVGALGQTFGVEDEEESEEKTTFVQDTRDQVTGFAQAFIDSLKGMFGSLTPGAFEMESVGNSTFSRKIKAEFSPLSAFSYMVFMLLFIPCVVTLAAIKQEFGWSLMFFEMGLLSIVPYISSTIIYQGGRLLGFH